MFYSLDSCLWWKCGADLDFKHMYIQVLRVLYLKRLEWMWLLVNKVLVLVLHFAAWIQIICQHKWQRTLGGFKQALLHLYVLLQWQAAVQRGPKEIINVTNCYSISLPPLQWVQLQQINHFNQLRWNRSEICRRVTQVIEVTERAYK